MNLSEIARSKGTNIKRLAEKCQIPASTLYAISSGETNVDNIGIDTFLKISGTLEMTAEELRSELGGALYGKVDAPTLTSDEQQLVDLYRAMTPQYRAMLTKTARLYAADSEKEADVPRGARSA